MANVVMRIPGQYMLCRQLRQTFLFDETITHAAESRRDEQRIKDEQWTDDN